MKDKIWTWVGRTAWIVGIVSFIKVFVVPWIETQGLLSVLKQLDAWLFLFLLSIGILLYELLMFFIRMDKKVETISQQASRYDQAIENVNKPGIKIEIVDQLRNEIKTLQNKYSEEISKWREVFANEVSDWKDTTIKKYQELAESLKGLKQLETDLGEFNSRNEKTINSLEVLRIWLQKIQDWMKDTDACIIQFEKLNEKLSSNIDDLQKRLETLEKGNLSRPSEKTQIVQPSKPRALSRELKTPDETAGARRLSQALFGGIIHIDIPQDKSQVVRPGIVSGEVSNPNLRVWVIVHPTGGKYYVQEEANVNSDGKWTAGVRIGREGTADVGKQFEIRAFANPFAHIQAGEVLESWCPAQFGSESITVTRK